MEEKTELKNCKKRFRKKWILAGLVFPLLIFTVYSLFVYSENKAWEKYEFELKQYAKSEEEKGNVYPGNDITIQRGNRGTDFAMAMYPISGNIYYWKCVNHLRQWTEDYLVGKYFDYVKSVRLDGPRITDEHVLKMPGSRSVSTLSISSDQLTEKSLSVGSRLPNLKTLKLHQNIIGKNSAHYAVHYRNLKSLYYYRQYGMPDDFLHKICSFGNLKSLWVGGKNITDDSLRHLSSLENLVQINLHVVSIEDRTLEQFRNLENLKLIDLYGKLNSPVNMEYFSGLPNLEYLYLRNLEIDQTTIESLKSCPKLTFLDLSETNVSDEAIPSLLAISSLKTVHLVSTNVTEEGVQRLKKKRPALNAKLRTRNHEEIILGN